MSIFKESFSPIIKAQLLKRGEILNRRNLTDIAIHNGTKAWLRMSSSVDVNGDAGALAKNYVLLGGALHDGKLRRGVGKGPENAYSLQTPSGKTHLYGVRPMPGITGVDIKSKGAYGSLREVTINFNCWDITQLEDLELLYMRPGYSVLLEWGWIPYVSNDGVLVSNPPMFNIFDSNLNGKDYQNVFQQLFKLEEEAHGNYGGFLGIIKNYKWSARPDGGYDCSTTLISIGEMIESLKINYSAANLSLITLQASGYLKIKDSDETPDPKYLKEFYQRNFLSGLFYELWKAVPSKNGSKKFEAVDKDGVIYDMFSMDIDISSQHEEDGLSDDAQKFITLESLCKLINNHVTVGIVAEDGNKPIIGVTTSAKPSQNGGSSENLKKPEKPYLLSLCHPLQISVNPSVCLIKNDIWGSFKLPESFGTSPTGSTPATAPGDPGPQAKNSDGTSKTITFYNSLVTVEAAAKIVITNTVIPEVVKFNSNENVIINSFTRYFEDCQKAGIDADTAARELQRQFELAVNVERKDGFITPQVSIGGNNLYKQDQLWAFLDEALEESEIEGISLGLKNLKGTDLGIVKAKKALITSQIETERQATTIRNQQESAASGLTFMKDLKPFSVSDADGTPDPACKAGFGLIGNIYVSLRYLLSICKDPGLEGSDKTGKNTINLYDFLKKILTDISSATGNVNNFDIHVDPLDSIARIIDINYVDPTKSKQEAYDETFTFYSEDGKPTGKYNGLKSTVRNYSLESQIFSEQSSIVAIGAQTGGGQLGLENDTMVGFNQGVIDRLKKTVSAMNTPKDSGTGIQLENLLTNLTPIYEFINEMKGIEADYTTDNASKYEGALRDLIAIFRALSKNPIKFKAIIPTKLSLEIDGISNLIIGHLFNIHPDLLPKGYKTDGEEVGRRLGYILTGIGHTVNDNGWVTKLEGQTIILEEPDGEEIDLFNVTLKSDGSVDEVNLNIERSPGRDGEDEVIATSTIGKAIAKTMSNIGKQAAGLCARYTYNHALNYVLALAGKTQNKQYAAGGNAKEESYFAALEKLGYTRYNLGTKSKADLKTYLAGNNFNIGDIVSYWGTTGNDSESIYGHTQIYAGGLQNWNVSLKYPVKSNWATDNYSNYGSSFVYNSKAPTNWGLVHFKAPKTAPSSVIASNGVKISLV